MGMNGLELLLSLSLCQLPSKLSCPSLFCLLQSKWSDRPDLADIRPTYAHITFQCKRASVGDWRLSKNGGWLKKNRECLFFSGSKHLLIYTVVSSQLVRIFGKTSPESEWKRNQTELDQSKCTWQDIIIRRAEGNEFPMSVVGSGGRGSSSRDDWSQRQLCGSCKRC